MASPPVIFEIRNLRSCISGCFTGCAAVQRIVAPLVVVEISEDKQLFLQVASSPKRDYIKVFSPYRPYESFNKRMEYRRQI